MQHLRKQVSAGQSKGAPGFITGCYGQQRDTLYFEELACEPLALDVPAADLAACMGGRMD